MKRTCVVWVLIGGLSGWVAETHAIATADVEISEASPTNQNYSLDWDYVYNYQGSSAVAVDHYWILTASHVADDGKSGTLEIDGETYTPQETVYHDTADLALVRYDKKFPGYYLLNEGAIYTASTTTMPGPGGGRTVTTYTYDTLLMVGYGNTGAVSTASFAETSGTYGTKRWGTNKGSAVSTVPVTVGSEIKTNQCFYMTFDSSDTDFECGGNTYDSGSPVFIESDGAWKVAGISLYRTGTDDVYTGNYAASISNYVSWVEEVIEDYDTDMDELPDWWEELYYPDADTTADADDDNDGQDNLAEFYAGTDPLDADSIFELQSSVTNDAGSVSFTLTFPAITNRTYAIESVAELDSDSWAVITNLTAASAGELEFVDEIITSLNFYRVDIELY